MKISKNSWHYRWFDYLRIELTKDSSLSSNLCGYFWTGVFLNIWLVAAQVFIIGIIFLLLSPILAFIDSNLFSLGLIVGIIELFIGLIAYSSYLYDKGGFVAVIVNYVKAVKGKYCPSLEFTE